VIVPLFYDKKHAPHSEGRFLSARLWCFSIVHELCKRQNRCGRPIGWRRVDERSFKNAAFQAGKSCFLSTFRLYFF